MSANINRKKYFNQPGTAYRGNNYNPNYRRNVNSDNNNNSNNNSNNNNNGAYNYNNNSIYSGNSTYNNNYSNYNNQGNYNSKYNDSRTMHENNSLSDVANDLADKNMLNEKEKDKNSIQDKRVSSVSDESDKVWLKVTNKLQKTTARTTTCIQVKTIYTGTRHWVRFYRGNIYKTGENGEDIYHWHLESHNFFDIEENRNKSMEKRSYLAFTDPDYEIIIMDKLPRYAFDSKINVGIRPILNYARWRQIKFKPNSFIAKNLEQIEEALKHIKYCLVENAVVVETGNDLCRSISKSIPINNRPHDRGIDECIEKNTKITEQDEIDDREKSDRTLHVIYPDYPTYNNILDETIEYNKLDIMAHSPLGCLESPR